MHWHWYLSSVIVDSVSSVSQSGCFHTPAWGAFFCIIVNDFVQPNGNVSKQTCKNKTQWSPNEPDSMMEFLNTSLLTIIICLYLSPPSNQSSWLSADVIIINLLRWVTDDWWEAHTNQWQMHDKCLLRRLPQQHLRRSSFSPHYTTNSALANN